MSDSTNFEMLELATGEVILRMAGDEQGYLLKVGFDQKMAGALGKNKFDVCREMMAAGIEALQDAQEKERALSFAGPMDTDHLDRETVLEYFAQEQPSDMDGARVLH